MGRKYIKGIEETLKFKGDLKQASKDWKEGRVGRSRPGLAGRRMDASHRPSDSPTYIRKFLPTFSHGLVHTLVSVVP